MENDTKDLSTKQLKERISDLEDAYAQLLAGGGSKSTLHNVWKEIQLLRRELHSRQ